MRQILRNIVAVFILLVVLLPTIIRAPAFAQEQGEEDAESNFGIAYPVDIVLPEGIELQNGMIISHKSGAYQPSDEAYDRSIIGAVSLFPAVEFVGDTATTNGDETPIISFGTTPVLVSGENGPIVKGDLITASSQPGVGMKAIKSGFTLGIAEEAFEGDSAEDTGLIKVQVGKDFTFAQDTPDSETIGNRLRDIVSLSAIAAIDDPKEVLKYVVAGVVLISAVVIAFISFSRTSQKGIEALGRNPLARSSIMTGIFVNILISIIIIAAGIAGSYFVVTL